MKKKVSLCFFNTLLLKPILLTCFPRSPSKPGSPVAPFSPATPGAPAVPWTPWGPCEWRVISIKHNRVLFWREMQFMAMKTWRSNFPVPVGAIVLALLFLGSCWLGRSLFYIIIEPHVRWKSWYNHLNFSTKKVTQHHKILRFYSYATTATFWDKNSAFTFFVEIVLTPIIGEFKALLSWFLYFPFHWKILPAPTLSKNIATWSQTSFLSPLKWSLRKIKV